MKKIFTLLAGIILATISSNAQEKVGDYYNNYFSKTYKVEASQSDGNFRVYFNVEGNSNGDDVCFSLKNEVIDQFVNALCEAKNKYLEWVNVAVNNNVTKMTKEMDITFPRVTIGWYGSKWWWAFDHKLTPLFMITDSGKHLFVIAGTATASSNEYIEQKYYLALECARDFDALISAISPTAIKEKLNNKQKVENLFQ